MLYVTILTGVLLAQPASAGALTSVIDDVVGDASPGYQDIVGAMITLKDGRFVVAMEMAESIPASPSLPPGAKLLMWEWGIDTNPATSPAGFPFAPGISSPTEYRVEVLWDGTNFIAQLVDRTPLLTGGEALVTQLSFNMKGARLQTSVDAAGIGTPSSFVWGAETSVWNAGLGSFSWFPVDRAGLASWPS